MDADLRRDRPDDEAAADMLPRGTVIGRYIVVDRLGAGGMGVVYAAYDPELDRRVALKLLRPQRARHPQSDGQARLVREAQAMARLSHPNVVSLYDVGTHGDDVFLAMELVEGQSLRAWLKAAPRPWREVVAHFVAAGRGLAAAHAAGLVHRDFKPDNVLVGREGRVRVMDFGLARQVEGTSAGLSQEEVEARPAESGTGPLSTPLTQEGHVLGTPSYMAPEQFRRLPADARADQFSFCVALYEGLYGERPFPSSRPPASDDGWWVLLEPPRGSRVPAWVRRVLVRGLSASPAERYLSMEALLAELENDVEARRRRWLVGAGAAALLGLSVGVAVHQVGARQAALCKGAERKLTGVWDAARKAALQQAFAATGSTSAADTWQRVQRVLDAYAAAWTGMHTEACEATRVRGEQSDEVLSLRMACLDRRLDGLRALTGVYAEADGQVVEQAVKAAHSLAGLEGCANVEALRATVPPPQDAATAARVQEVRTRLAGARALANAGRYRQGLEVATAVVAEARTLKYLPLEAECLALLGEVQEKSGELDAAARSLEDALLAAQAGRHDEAGAGAASMLVWVEMRRARVEQGHRWADYAQATLTRAGGPPEPEALLSLALGGLFHQEGRHAEAAAHYEQSLRQRERLYGPDHPGTAVALNNLALVRMEQGQVQQARASFERVVAINTRAMGPEHPLTGKALLNLGNTFLAEAQEEKALETYQRALPVLERALGKDHPDLSELLLNMGSAHLYLGHAGQAAEHFQAGLALLERTLGPAHPTVARALVNLGSVAMVQGDAEGARRLFRRALSIQETSGGASQLEVAVTHFDEADALLALGHHAEARAGYQRALTLFEQSTGAQSPYYASGLAGMGGWLLEQGRNAEAAEHFRRALALQEATFGPAHPELVPALTGLGRSLLGLKASAEALRLLERALALCRSPRVQPQKVAETRLALARALWETHGDRARARELAAAARDVYTKVGTRRERATAESWLAGHDVP